MMCDGVFSFAAEVPHFRGFIALNTCRKAWVSSANPRSKTVLNTFTTSHRHQNPEEMAKEIAEAGCETILALGK